MADFPKRGAKDNRRAFSTEATIIHTVRYRRITLSIQVTARYSSSTMQHLFKTTARFSQIHSSFIRFKYCYFGLLALCVSGSWRIDDECVSARTVQLHRHTNVHCYDSMLHTFSIVVRIKQRLTNIFYLFIMCMQQGRFSPLVIYV